VALLTPYRPSSRRPWDRAAAAHLLRRAGFAPSPEETAAALADGPGPTVDRLVNARDESERYRELDELGIKLANRNNIPALRGWWMMRMRYTQRPLHARMALFWHNHFATSNAKVRNPLMMLQQLRCFERNALGRFDDLLREVSRDPAMIVWLDGASNVKGRPNENFARELFELFTLGLGNYTEADIREAARAFTGWSQRDGVFTFVERDHDGGDKTVFGVRAPLDGDDVIRLALTEPASASFMATKLLRVFVCPDPPPPLVDAVSAYLRSNRFHVGETLRALLKSEAMFDPRWYRSRIKSPVELTVGLARSLDARTSSRDMAGAASQMGQRLFEPPSVKGWDGHRAWLNSATMLVRLNTAAATVEPGSRFDPAVIVRRHGLEDRDAVVAFCRDLALDGIVPDALGRRLGAVSGTPAECMRSCLQYLLTSPEYQMA
jgi:uncharacterized protein (DUF1800 family)